MIPAPVVAGKNIKNAMEDKKSKAFKLIWTQISTDIHRYLFIFLHLIS